MSESNPSTSPNQIGHAEQIAVVLAHYYRAQDQRLQQMTPFVELQRLILRDIADVLARTSSSTDRVNEYLLLYIVGQALRQAGYVETPPDRLVRQLRGLLHTWEVNKVIYPDEYHIADALLRELEGYIGQAAEHGTVSKH